MAGALLLVAVLMIGCAPQPTGDADRSPGARSPDEGELASPRLIETSQDLPDAYRPHPEFDLTIAQLREIVDNQPSAIREAIMAEPTVFLEYAIRLLPRSAYDLALVDKQNPLPTDYVPQDLLPLDRYADQLILNREGLSLRAVIMPDLLAMVEAARQDGIQLDISSTYRSYDYQRNLFDYWVAELGQAEAERVSARAGTSQHQLGTTLDFGSVTRAFAEHPAGVWLAEHAGRYGFSLSYPEGYEELTGYSFEPWHFRWLSRAGTQMEARYFDGIQQYFLEFWAQAEPLLRDACSGGSCRDTVQP